MRGLRMVAGAFVLILVHSAPLQAQYANFESSKVHPVALTPSGQNLLLVNTPDALLEVFTVQADGGLAPWASIPVGLEPVSVLARSDSEAWVVNHLSDTISIVDLARGATIRTLPVGDEPTDVVFANGRAFVAVSQEDAVVVFDLTHPADPPVKKDLFGSDTRALAVSMDGSKVYAVVLNSGNQTTAVNAHVIFNGGGRPAPNPPSPPLLDPRARPIPPTPPPP